MDNIHHWLGVFGLFLAAVSITTKLILPNLARILGEFEGEGCYERRRRK